MDLRRLRHFHVLAESLNFSRAAQRLHMAQPALSVSIQKLEAELGTRLFERTSSGVVLTAVGQAALVEARGAMFMECPVSGGCHRADTGNIAIFAGGPRAAFEFVLPVLTTMGRRILHTGDLGTASQLKVMTNYLCTVHLVALAEALTTCKAIGLDMNTTYEAIRISSGNSFVHETESQVILNGSRDINFTMDLVSKDVGLFDKIAHAANVPVELSPLIVKIFKEGEEAFGSREFSPNIIRRYEEPLGIKVLGTGFPADMVDDEPEERGYEVVPKR
jgi:3-hydroxyisobutyrate dehydrogenase